MRAIALATTLAIILLIAAFISNAALDEQPVMFCSERVSTGLQPNESATAYSVGRYELRRFELKFEDNFLNATLKGLSEYEDGVYPCERIWPRMAPQEIMCHLQAASIGYNTRTNKGTFANYYGDINPPRGKTGDSLIVSVFTCDEF